MTFFPSRHSYAALVATQQVSQLVSIAAYLKKKLQKNTTKSVLSCTGLAPTRLKEMRGWGYVH